MLKKLRSFETLVVFGLYFLPVMLWSLFGFSRMNHASHWTFFSLGLTIACFGGIAVWLLTSREPHEPLAEPLPSPLPPLPVFHEPEPLPPPPMPEQPHPDEALLLEKQKLEEQIESLKSTHANEKHESTIQLLNLKDELEEKDKTLFQKEERITELQQKIAELDYEIKALIDFNHETSYEDHFTLNEQDAGKILKKWIDAASALSPSENEFHSPDQNLSRLIQGEPQALVFIYDPKEEIVLSTNSHSLTLLGITPEQFANRFHTYLPKDSLEWHEVKSKVSEAKWAGIKLDSCQATLGAIQDGPLRGHILGIAY